jgi:hypothetical protein
MAVSQYFNNYHSSGEQRLIEDLIVESIKIQGFDAYYIPMDNTVARDLLYGEDPIKKFKAAYQLEMYLSSSTEYMGEKEFFSKFGLEIKNNANVILSKRSFSQRVPQNTFTRPREGDLVYVPFLNGTGELFEIKFTNQTKDFFMLGRKVPYFYELELEKFKYSQESITTGIDDIDQVVTDSAYTLHLNVGAGTGTYTIKELVYQSLDNTYANAKTIATVQSWIPSSNTLSVTNIMGTFGNTTPIIGVTSNAQYILASFDPLNTPSTHENYDNSYINTAGNAISDFSENNPFGGL